MRLLFNLIGFFWCVAASTLTLDVISYDRLIENDPVALQTLKKALFEKGIVGVRNIPSYRDKVARFIESSRLFTVLPEEIKGQYSRQPGEMFLGYELGKEKFVRPDGTWIIDDQKASYYALIPDAKENKTNRLCTSNNHSD